VAEAGREGEPDDLYRRAFLPEHNLGETGTKMERSQRYKDWVIRADPIRLYVPIRWSIAVVIERHHAGEVKTVRHHAAETRPTKDEATASSLEFGRQIVDGQHPELSLP